MASPSYLHRHGTIQWHSAHAWKWPLLDLKLYHCLEFFNNF